MATTQKDERVEIAIHHWAPRFVSAGVPLADFDEVTAAITRWDEWCAVWSKRAAEHEKMGREAVAQRYNAANGIPTTLRRLDQTLANSGRFYFGNLAKGQHTLKVTLDGGKSFIAERSLFIGRTREEAESPFKSLLYLVGIDVKGPNPTPASCPSEEAP